MPDQRQRIVLTRLLYEAHEVELSLVNAIIDQREPAEAYFWTAELHASGLSERLWDTIWRAYYDFYAAVHPMLERHLERIHGEYLARPALRPAAVAVLNLLGRRPDPRVLELRLCTEDAPAQSQEVALGLLLHAVRAGDLRAAAACLRTVPCCRTAYEALIYTWSELEGIEMPPASRLNPHYSDLWHSILAMVVSMATPNGSVVFECLIIMPDMDEVATAEASCPPPDSIDNGYLERERRCAVEPSIGAFALPRRSVAPAPFTEHLWSTWRVYAARCPLWASRLHAAGATVTDTSVAFPTEEAETEFSRRWDAAPDEQPSDIQAAATGVITALPYAAWTHSLFRREPEHPVPDLPAYH